ncbi:Bax inhibitor-1/YccA family protein [uncultured Treponema sp.]|uniref:Bax inhibitor-1/YccA family protein n=1 Tax=uncultured Treponema sp. TaxID=162155 RepID=UPI0025DC7F78|nr:Bax inhibitor-1/YccA family protein [uncultured Treponema sp.]
MERTISAVESEKSKFVTKTYAWMGLALLISAVSAFTTAIKIYDDAGLSAFGQFLYGNRMMGFWIFVIAEIVLVWGLSAAIRKISLGTAIIGFLAYSVLNGITLSSIFIVYKIESIAVAFVATSVMFFTMAFYGATTKKNLATLGKYMMMALIGIIVVSLLEFIMFRFFSLNTSILDLLIGVATVIVFTGLTAYDSQKLLKVAQHSNGNEDWQKVSVMAALELYLDFINLFLALLRIFGRKK